MAGTTIPTVSTAMLPEWEKDESSNVCLQCNEAFWMLKRRHHCRRCGGLYCHYCSANNIKLIRYGIHEETRVCDNCFLLETAHLPLLQKGVELVLWSGDHPDRRSAFLSLSVDLMTLQWSVGSDIHSLGVISITKVMKGKLGSSLRSASASEELCFSLECDTLHLSVGFECPSKHSRDCFVEALRALLFIEKKRVSISPTPSPKSPLLVKKQTSRATADPEDKEALFKPQGGSASNDDDAKSGTRGESPDKGEGGNGVLPNNAQSANHKDRKNQKKKKKFKKGNRF